MAAGRRARQRGTAGATGTLRLTSQVFALKFVSSAAGGAVAVVTARVLGPTGRGELVLLFTLAAFSLLICCMGINFSGRIHLVSRADPVTTGDYIGLSYALGVMQVMACMILGFLLLPAVDVHLSFGDEVAFSLMAGSMLVQYLLLDGINAFGHLSLSSTVDATGSVAQLVLVSAAVALRAKEVTTFVLVLTAANCLQILASLLALRRVGSSIRARYRRRQWMVLVRSGLPGIVVGVGTVLTFRLDRYLVGLYLSPAAVGIYSVAATAPELLRLVPLSFGQPIIHRLAAGVADAADFRRARLLCLAVVLACAAVTWAVAPYAVRILFGSKYAGAVTPLRVLLLAEFGTTLFYLDSSALTGLNQMRYAALPVVPALVLVVVGDIALIPDHGLVGAAWASVAAYSVMGIAAHVLLRRQVAKRAQPAGPGDTAGRPGASEVPPDGSAGVPPTGTRLGG